jgi:predicted TIM-barrel fold metal-dependent hydrolase
MASAVSLQRGASASAIRAPGRYRLIDADAHVNEPPDLWVSRVSARYRDRVPRMQRFSDGDAWVIEGAAEPINFGFNACAGMEPSKRRAWMKWEDVRAGGYDPAARLREIAEGGTDAQVLYPTPRLSHGVIATPDPDMHLEMVRAYNDWISEFAAYDPSRLGGIFLLPNRGVEMAVEEVRRLAGRPGLVGALLGCFPHGDLDLTEDDDPLWSALEEHGIVLHIHVGLVSEMPKDIFASKVVSVGHLGGDLRFLQAPQRMMQFVVGRVFERFPRLRVVLAEVDAGWVPYLKEQVDNRYRRRLDHAATPGYVLPSEVIERHFWYTYITDHFAIQQRHAIGVDRIMWSSDYPHSGSDWPASWRVIDADFAGIPDDERDRILARNALELYGFGTANTAQVQAGETAGQPAATE